MSPKDDEASWTAARPSGCLRISTRTRRGSSSSPRCSPTRIAAIVLVEGLTFPDEASAG